MTAEPRWATPRTARRRTAGPDVAKVAKQLGLPMLPWQRSVLSVALERQGSRPAFRDVLISVPRQSGKTSLAAALIVWKLLSAPNMRVLYGAQSRLSAREMMLYAWWPLIASSELAGRFRLARGFGAETITADNGSQLALISSAMSSGHGRTTDLVVLDECWVHVDARVEQAVRPTMATRRDAQLFALSTAGTAASVWLRDKLDAGRTAAEMGVTDGVCCFDFGASDDANPADESTWWSAMPALGTLVDVATVRSDFLSMPLPEFRRAFLNMWVETEAEGWKLIPQAIWEAARDD